MKQLLYIICCFYAISNYAQKNVDEASATFELSEIAMLDLEPNNSTVTLSLDAPNNSGDKAKVVMANNQKWINFSSAIAKNGSPRNISIKIEDGEVPSGIHLKLNTSVYSGGGKGVLGSPVKKITLSKASQPIVTNIGGAYTGNGINNGYQLSYYLEIYDYKLLDFDKSATLSISLTLTDY